jgi:hypothetical protein
VDRPEAPLPAPDATLMPGVLAPRLLPAAAQASVRQQARESIGTYEWQDFTAPGSRLVNTNGDWISRQAGGATSDPRRLLGPDKTAPSAQVTRHLSSGRHLRQSVGLAADPDEAAGTMITPRRAPASSCATRSTSKPASPRAYQRHAGCPFRREPRRRQDGVGLPSNASTGMMLATSSLFEPARVLDLDHDSSPDSEPRSGAASGSAGSSRWIITRRSVTVAESPDRAQAARRGRCRLRCSGGTRAAGIGERIRPRHDGARLAFAPLCRWD